MEDISLGLCQCGCGKRTKIADENNSSRGYVKGKPLRFLHGHGATGRPIIEKRWRVEDRGYETSCWIWLLTTNNKGYANGWDAKESRVRAAYVIEWEKENGPVPDGLELDHLCKQRDCVRHSHLEAVSHTENIRRGNSAKLNYELAEEIRSRYASGDQQTQLAVDFEVTQTTISRVVLRKTWK